ncbi:hypothetical protein HO173_005566 [Letharia columbiana]|uniref:Uncharacterized protein n=1 Tax=Letharia columbiana TaxID=112416 RepID=A0A8H6FWY3_9LECA|nr:uncharacterized protein HO173_005566 [Letharia columbiana]KAF6236313.1 hypothetical protein HO173_005566 [Letharia columbiana]
MSDSDYEPISQPNSTINGFPSFCQVQLVTKGLEKNPFPREDFYRQFSVTPERQTPESQRTPHWSIPDPDDYREAAEGAEEAAESLKRFYGGRVLLREDPDGSMICGHDSAHWRSKATSWLDEIQKLQELYEKRIEQEQRGEAEKGHAQALFLSPIQSPSPPQSDGVLLATAAGIKKRKPTAARSFQQHFQSSQQAKAYISGEGTRGGRDKFDSSVLWHKTTKANDRSNTKGQAASCHRKRTRAANQYFEGLEDHHKEDEKAKEYTLERPSGSACPALDATIKRCNIIPRDWYKSSFEEEASPRLRESL